MYRYINLVFLVLLYAVFQLSNKDALAPSFKDLSEDDLFD